MRAGVARHHAPVAQALRVRHRDVVLADRVDHHRAHVQHPAAGEGARRSRAIGSCAWRNALERNAQLKPGDEAAVVRVLDREPAAASARGSRRRASAVKNAGNAPSAISVGHDDGVDRAAAPPRGDHADRRSRGRTRAGTRRRRGRSSTGSVRPIDLRDRRRVVRRRDAEVEVRRAGAGRRRSRARSTPCRRRAAPGRSG